MGAEKKNRNHDPWRSATRFRNCAIDQVCRKTEIEFRGLIGRAISDSTESTRKIMVMY